MEGPNEGVQDSTADDRADLAFLNEEESSSRDEPKITPAQEEEEAPPDEESEPDAKAAKEDEDKDEPEKDRPPVHDRPSMQQLREAFPDLFKKFPSLRDIYYREQEFTQIFSTVEDAKEASSNSTAFQDITDKVLKADTQGIFDAIKETDAKAFAKIVDNVLPTLYKISPDAHWKATLPLMQNLVRGFYMEGKRRNDENVVNSAEYLSDFIFGDIKVARGERDVAPKVSEESEEAKALSAEKAKFLVDRIDNFTSSIRSKADDSLKRAVNETAKIDPDGAFSEFIRETIVGKTLQEIDKQLTADKSHMRYMNSLWDKAKKDGFSEEWKSRILSAYLARAKSLIPSIRAKFVSEAMGSSSKATEKRKEILDKNSSRREPGTGGRQSREGSNGHVDARRVDWGKTSDLDLIEDRVTYRKG